MSRFFNKRFGLLAGCFSVLALAGLFILNEPVSYAELAYTEYSYVLGVDAGSVIPASCESGYEHSSGECADVWWCDSQSGLGAAWCTNQCCTMSNGAVQCGTNGGTNTTETSSFTDDNAIANGWCTTDTTTVTNSCGIGGGTSSNTQCSCDAGYTMSGGTCVCDTTSYNVYSTTPIPNGSCQNSSRNTYFACTNTTYEGPVTASCSCNAGYTWNGSGCIANSCPPSYSYQELNPSSIATYCGACPAGTSQPSSLSCTAATTGWENYGPTCTAPSCSGCGCVPNAIPVNGSCGDAERNYASGETSFSGALCDPGNASPGSPTFPAQGGSSSWTCQGVNGGSNSPACVATRDSVASYSCTGSIPANAGPYDAEESTGLAANAVWTYSGSDTGTKCQFTCTSGTWNGSSCAVVADSCTGTAEVTVTGSTSGGTVWGTDVYTDDSDVGKAAVHFGIITPGQNAVIRKTFSGTRSGYIGSTRNGVTTSSYAPQWCSMTLSLVPTPPPPPPPEISGTITPTTCEIPANASTCEANVTWDTTNASNVSVKAESAVISSGQADNSSGLAQTVTYGNTMFSLYNGGTLLNAKQITVGCVTDHTWVGGVCVSSLLPPTLTVSKPTVSMGGTVTLSWDTNNGDETSCSLSGQGVSNATLDAGGGNVDPETGSVNVVINGRTRFVLTCAGLTAIKTVEVIPSSWES